MLRRRKADFAETAISMPVILLATLFMVNVALAVYTSVVAQNAAAYGARIGSVSRTFSAGQASQAAHLMLQASGLRAASYSVGAWSQDTPGGFTVVSVSWQMPSWFSGLAAFYGGGPSSFSGTSVAVFKKEGW